MIRFEQNKNCCGKLRCSLKAPARICESVSGSHALAAPAPDQLRLRRGRVLRPGRAAQLRRAASAPAGLISTSLLSDCSTEG